MAAPAAAAAATSMVSPPRGADVLATLAGIPLADIPTVAGPEALEARYVNHQLAVNGCLLAIRQACRAHPGSHPPASGRPTRTRGCGIRWGGAGGPCIPTPSQTINVDGRRRWINLEVDRGTAELRRYRLKLRRYAHFYLSGSWRREYTTFPEVRIVTAHRPRMRRMLAELEEAVRSFNRAEHDALMARLVVSGDVGIGVPGGSERGAVMDAYVRPRPGGVAAPVPRCCQHQARHECCFAPQEGQWTSSRSVVVSVLKPLLETCRVEHRPNPATMASSRLVFLLVMMFGGSVVGPTHALQSHTASVSCLRSHKLLGPGGRAAGGPNGVRECCRG